MILKIKEKKHTKINKKFTLKDFEDNEVIYSLDTYIDDVNNPRTLSTKTCKSLSEIKETLKEVIAEDQLARTQITYLSCNESLKYFKYKWLVTTYTTSDSTKKCIVTPFTTYLLNNNGQTIDTLHKEFKRAKKTQSEKYYANKTTVNDLKELMNMFKDDMFYAGALIHKEDTNKSELTCTTDSGKCSKLEIILHDSGETRLVATKIPSNDNEVIGVDIIRSIGDLNYLKNWMLEGNVILSDKKILAYYKEKIKETKSSGKLIIETVGEDNVTNCHYKNKNIEIVRDFSNKKIVSYKANKYTVGKESTGFIGAQKLITKKDVDSVIDWLVEEEAPLKGIKEQIESTITKPINLDK